MQRLTDRLTDTILEGLMVTEPVDVGDHQAIKEPVDIDDCRAVGEPVDGAKGEEPVDDLIIGREE